ncbi:DDE Tnp4 domain-containing protein [Trichonephila inaurata madagascariensis]|uniref:DDE Tnp4 domain-containing protein n=1 Tax=Trichonephila inaurata madagascariensis TaxID=2747483 RepID=A0A8X7C7Y5_9ARAC|nr:DDE Tnp4 domain-containing protein [Trichonephila inaurata madagascariensis]
MTSIGTVFCYKVKFPSTRRDERILKKFVQTGFHINLNHLRQKQYKQKKSSMIGITSNGAISFISEFFTGSISDKEVFIRSKLMDRLELNDVVMADKDFLIANELEKIGCKLYRPIFLEDKIQFDLSEMVYFWTNHCYGFCEVMLSIFSKREREIFCM